MEQHSPQPADPTTPHLALVDTDAGERIIEAAIKERERARARRRWLRRAMMVAILVAVVASVATSKRAQPEVVTVADQQRIAGDHVLAALDQVDPSGARAPASGSTRSVQPSPELIGVVTEIATDPLTRPKLDLLRDAASDGLTESEIDQLAPQLQGAVSDEQLDELTCALDGVYRASGLAERVGDSAGTNPIGVAIGVLTGTTAEKVGNELNAENPGEGLDAALDPANAPGCA